VYMSVFTFQACVPYFEMLEKWIYKGIIQDPYAEVTHVSMYPSYE